MKFFFKVRRFLYQWSHYEYWPWLFFYLPIVPLHLYFALRSRYFFFSTAANPSIDKGGLFGESKMDILNNFSEDLKPKSTRHNRTDKIENTLKLIKESGFEFPLIIKPNIGERGAQVAKINTESEAYSYLEQSMEDCIIQEYIDYELELGVLYGRMPGEEKGKVRSIVKKKFLSVTGNGIDTVENLLLRNKRAWFQMERLKNEKPELMKTVLIAGEYKLVEPIGNHCRGTEFIDANYLITEPLHEIFDKITSQFEGFYYGRFDLKVRSEELFSQGQSIKIFELNGVTSEPGHIYDKNYTLFKAYRDLIREYRFIFKMSMANIKSGIKPLSAGFMVPHILKHFGAKN